MITLQALYKNASVLKYVVYNLFAYDNFISTLQEL
jgi:hypothetical protein